MQLWMKCGHENQISKSKQFRELEFQLLEVFCRSIGTRCTTMGLEICACRESRGDPSREGEISIRSSSTLDEVNIDDEL